MRLLGASKSEIGRTDRRLETLRQMMLPFGGRISSSSGKVLVLFNVN